MKVVKALNNNMVLVRDENGNESICQGKGIGFQKKTGDCLEEDKIERRFIPENASDSRHFQELFMETPDPRFHLMKFQNSSEALWTSCSNPFRLSLMKRSGTTRDFLLISSSLLSVSFPGNAMKIRKMMTFSPSFPDALSM